MRGDAPQGQGEREEEEEEATAAGGRLRVLPTGGVPCRVRGWPGERKKPRPPSRAEGPSGRERSAEQSRPAEVCDAAASRRLLRRRPAGRGAGSALGRHEAGSSCSLPPTPFAHQRLRFLLFFRRHDPPRRPAGRGAEASRRKNCKRTLSAARSEELPSGEECCGWWAIAGGGRPSRAVPCGPRPLWRHDAAPECRPGSPAVGVLSAPAAAAGAEARP